MNSATWTDSDLAMVRAFYPTQSARQIAQCLGRTEYAVYNAARGLGIKKSSEALSAIQRAREDEPPESFKAAQFKSTHGQAHPPSKTYLAWIGMRARCNDSTRHDWSRYGGRGIVVCERWQSDFTVFYEDMGECPAEFTLGRIDNDGDYTPGNCRWESQKQQARNRSSNRLIEAFGQTRCLADWADLYGLRGDTLAFRLRRLAPEAALTKTKRKYGRAK